MNLPDMREDILGIRFDPLTMEEAVSRALALTETGRGAYMCTPNPEIVVRAMRSGALTDAIDRADLVLPDGVGILWAAKKLGKRIPERVAGYDVLMALLERMTGRVYILGGRPGVAAKAAENIRTRFPNVEIAGWNDGYFSDDEEEDILAQIRRARPKLLLVCLGAPRQELWMAAHPLPEAGLMAGLGGSVDVLAGTVKRAPYAWRRRGLEWLYRLICQPWRAWRQRRLVIFAVETLRRRRTCQKED